MQLMPYTAKLVAKQAKLPYSKSRLTTDPEYNINLGSHYIAGLILDFFSNTYGIITFSLLLSAWFRPYFLKFYFGHFDASKVRKTADYIKETSLYQKLTFLILMYFTHQFLLFSIEAFSFEKLDWIIKKTLISTIISIILCYIFILIFYTKNAR